jgi:valyl-tRNA synthetase
MDFLLESRINHAGLEKKWQEKWFNEKTFKSVPDTRTKFSMVIPPPNVTGVLHMGHALNNTFQDVIARSKRSQGYNVCWIPGTDHAGIATQVKVQKELELKGIKSNELTREEFLSHIYAWKEASGSTIITQLKRLGCSCDWDRECFTMNQDFSNHVKDIFIKLYEDKLIYRANYMINWDPVLQTAIADDEVETKACKSKLYWIKYFNTNKTKYVVVATSRPETLFGDVAIGFNNLDVRYQNNTDEYYIPIINRPIKLIPDTEVDKDFGSGLVKITPAHDKFDFEFANRHKLEPIQIINKKGLICNTGTSYDTMPISVARRIIVKELNELGHIEKIVEYDSVQKLCYRTGTQIEPMYTNQWFVDLKKLGSEMDSIIESGEIELFPENQVNNYKSWIEGLRPWCISRQLVWGHRIPVFYCENCSEQVVSTNSDVICSKCMNQMIQDPDVLDTWFSSWLWPYGVFNLEEINYYFPTDYLITGSDILFFWVIRMIIASKYMKGTKPFSKVYLHGIVRDESNKKMSKSLGNIIDPLYLIDKFGCDPVRFSLLMTTPYSSDVPISEKTFTIGKTLCTKLWNVIRCIQNIMLSNTSEMQNYDKTTLHNLLTTLSDEKDIQTIKILNQTKTNIISKLDIFEFAKATKEIYTWIWDILANDYLEYAKNNSEKTKILVFLAYNTLYISEPFIPHISSELIEILDKTINYIQSNANI